jgi:hypothetical protein
MNMQEKAFPNPHLIGETGMTLRDYFAAKALDYAWNHSIDDARAAARAYELADAMMEARK